MSAVLLALKVLGVAAVVIILLAVAVGIVFGIAARVFLMADATPWTTPDLGDEGEDGQP